MPTARRPAVFCRFTGCNLWSGREADRASAVCRFCDTDFVGTDGPGGENSPRRTRWPPPSPLVGPPRRREPGLTWFCTGGEPLLQLDELLIAALHARGFEVAVETNGTLTAPSGLD